MQPIDEVRARSVKVKLFTKDGCGLCDEVKGALGFLQEQYPHVLLEVDITANAKLFEAYKFIIPVVEIGEERLEAPIKTADLRTALAKNKRE